MTLSLRLRELDSVFFQGREELGQSQLMVGRCDAAIATMANMPAFGAPSHQGLLGWTYGRCGRVADAKRERARLAAAGARGQYASHFATAMIDAGLNERDAAFAELDSAYTERAWPMIELHLSPVFDTLRDDPRFARLLARMERAEPPH